ncbi:MAG: fructose-1,6-bisphosphatase [Patescibacteria group bacterium]|nr:fructose-1,6-bisphosphatase [Patescibacteria group bacterium]MCL5095375.1 fructose-1,6-bisphosphatase [Patescibacteria group bacterium]
MKITLSVIKADIGSIGGHECPSQAVYETVKDYIEKNSQGLLIDYFQTFLGDDIALLMTHTKGEGNSDIHKLAWDSFKAGTEVAKKQGLYGAGQDLLKESFSGNVKGMGPGVCEMEIEERPNEPFVFFQADKTDPGAFNLPLYLSFADPMYSPGLFISKSMRKGFEFTVMNVYHTEGDKIVTLKAPEELYSIAVLLRDLETYVIESVHSRDNGEIAAVVSTSRLHNIAGTYVGKDDPVALVRAQKLFPDTGEILSPYAIGYFVAGDNRGSHNTPLMPIKTRSTVAYFDGPACVSALGFCVHEGKLTEPVDLFDHPVWERVRSKISDKAIELRKQGFFGAAMLGMNELEYTEIVDHIKELDSRFKVRNK